jgi:hypothetical protein
VIATGGGVTGVALGAGAEPRPAGTSPAPAARAVLRISRLAATRISRRAVRVRGRSSARPAKRLTIALRTRGGKLVAQESARIRGGRFSVRLQSARRIRAGRYRFSVRYAGDKQIAPVSLTRTLKLT